MHQERAMGNHPLRIAALLLCLLLSAGMAWAGANPRTLLAESENRHRSRSQQYAGALTVVSKDGKSRNKGWRSYREGYAGDAKTMVRFTSPPEVKGVGFLSLSRAGKNSDQWLYLPSMKRERRIGTQDRDGSFVGTDFSYEDMEEFDHEKYKVTLRSDEVVAGQPCYVIEAVPMEKAGQSAYEKRLLYLRKDILYLVRQDLYRNGAKEPSKRLILADLQNVAGHWIAKRWVMDDLKKGSKTTVLLDEVKFDAAQPGDRYTLKNLNREGGD